MACLRLVDGTDICKADSATVAEEMNEERFSGAGSESMAETMDFSGARRVASDAVLKYSGRERTEMIRELG